MARTFNESKAVFLAGPIEWWWDTEEDPNRFMSEDAVAYRAHRNLVRDIFVKHHFLVYSPHSAFKGDWNEKMQPVNDYVLSLCDMLVDLSPTHIPGLVKNGTSHEIEVALKAGKFVMAIPPTAPAQWIEYQVEHLVKSPPFSFTRLIRDGR